jgi:2-amino-4-hydroxy-6-hydroxymethyldihydropteridine diphosphokinase
MKAFIAIGSNLGERLEHLRAAVNALEALPKTQVIGKSRIYETEPVGGPDNQGAYLNAVVQLETRLKPRELLEALLEIERSRGRVRTARWGPRTLDLDVLLYGPRIIHQDHLTVPHPRLHERAFVLEPLHDLAPDLEIPGLGVTVAELRERVDRSGVWASALEW